MSWLERLLFCSPFVAIWLYVEVDQFRDRRRQRRPGYLIPPASPVTRASAWGTSALCVRCLREDAARLARVRRRADDSRRAQRAVVCRVLREVVLSIAGSLAAFVLCAASAAFVLLLSPNQEGVLVAVVFFALWLACVTETRRRRWRRR
jgi:hypothetical protein